MFSIAFYDTRIHTSIPQGSLDLTEAQWREFLDNNGTRRWVNGQVVVYDPPLPQPVELQASTWKTDVWDRATSEEADVLDAALRSTPAKVRRFCDDSLRIWHDHPLFLPQLKRPFADHFGNERAQFVFAESGREQRNSLTEQAYGAERAGEILAPTP